MTAKTEPGGNDPSMDDILASIRRILDEEEIKPSEAPAMPPASPLGLQEDDVLQLEPSMMVPEPEAGPGPVPVPPPILLEAAAVPVPMQQPERPPVPDAPPPSLPPPQQVVAASPLMAPAAAAAAAVSVEALMRTLATEKSSAVHRGGPTIEDLVREEMRPLLKEWLDTHLAPMVERLVRLEIERVVNRLP